MLEDIEIGRADNVMGLVDQDEFIAGGIELVKAIA